MAQCLFCKIIAGEVPAEKVSETQSIVAIKDINPAAPVHILLMPKKHIATIDDLKEEDKQLVGEVYLMAKTIAQQKGINEAGYRIVANCNSGAGQSVFHIHFHLLGGRNFKWPPG